MEITFKLSIIKDGSFENLLHFWSFIQKFIVEKYNWPELPEKFEQHDCKFTEYEDSFPAYIYKCYYDISFEKGDMKIEIGLEDNEITNEYVIRFFKNGPDKSHNFFLTTDLEEFKCNTENPFYDELINSVKSIPEINQMIPDEISMIKNKGTIDHELVWNWLRTVLSKKYPDLTFPETINLKFYEAENEYYFHHKTDIVNLGVYLRDRNKIKSLTFSMEFKDKMQNIYLNIYLDEMKLRMHYSHPEKLFWKEKFKILDKDL